MKKFRILVSLLESASLWAIGFFVAKIVYDVVTRI